MTQSITRPRAADILADISDGCAALDNDWRFTYLNAAAARIAGRRASDLLGRTLFNALGNEPDNPFLASYVASKASGEPAVFTAYSEVFRMWLEVRGYPRPDGYTIFFRDVTAERGAQLAALEREQRRAAAQAINQRLFETSIDLILVVDRKGTFVRVSPSARAILGYEPEEMIGHSATEFIHAEDLDSTRTEMRLARRGRATRNFECRYVHKAGPIVPMVWSGVWSEPEEQHFFIGRDMTERIAQEARLRHTQRLESIGRLTGGIAHDFNNLLGIVVGNLELLRAAVSPDPAASEHLQEILEAAQRGGELISRLLAFARRQQLNPASADVNALVTSIAKLLARVLGASIRFELDLAPELWPARVDVAQLEAVITNLATNARDAMPTGGTLTLRTANDRREREATGESAEVAEGDYVRIEVSDTGTGIPPEIQARIFEPFFSTKAEGRGSGLGLSMVYGFIKQSGGHVSLSSELGHGTCFRLFLPRDRSDAGD
jgi:PAS domain S-box-containing protein